MSNESENDMDDIEAEVDRIASSTIVIMTPEEDEMLGIMGTFHLYSNGMWDNYDLPDIEIRGVPGGFVKTAAAVVNEMNAYRLAKPEKPFLNGQTVTWHTGDFIITKGESWDGRYSWTPETMLRLVPRLEDVEHCHSCGNEDQE